MYLGSPIAALDVPGSVVTVEHFEYERRRDAGQSVDGSTFSACS
jgi:hypothetical protein